MTLAWAVVDAGTGEAWSVVAGHPPPRLLRADGRSQRLALGGPLLGVLPEAQFSASADRLGPGDALVLFTDGATEAQDAAGHELGPDGLDALLARAPRPPDALADAVVGAVDAWAGEGGADDDDLTLVVVRRV